MIDGYDRVISRRAWFVPDFSVWGETSLGEHEYLALDKIDGIWSIYYGTATIGQNTQEVLFEQLVDHRGNSLPKAINAPRVFVRPKDDASAFVVGREAADRFRIAQAGDGPVTVDLWVMELGD